MSLTIRRPVSSFRGPMMARLPQHANTRKSCKSCKGPFENVIRMSQQPSHSSCWTAVAEGWHPFLCLTNKILEQLWRTTLFLIWQMVAVATFMKHQECGYDITALFDHRRAPKGRKIHSFIRCFTMCSPGGGPSCCNCYSVSAILLP
jgi:hypothetical protein